MPNGVGAFAQQYVPGAGAAMNTFSSAQHTFSQVSNTFNSATSGQWGRRDGPEGFQEPQPGWMPREFSFSAPESLAQGRLMLSWCGSQLRVLLLKLSTAVHLASTNSTSPTPRVATRVPLNRCMVPDRNRSTEPRRRSTEVRRDRRHRSAMSTMPPPARARDMLRGSTCRRPVRHSSSSSTTEVRPVRLVRPVRRTGVNSTDSSRRLMGIMARITLTAASRRAGTARIISSTVEGIRAGGEQQRFGGGLIRQ